MPVRSKRKLPSDTLIGDTGKSTGSSNQTILPPSHRLHPPIGRQSVSKRVKPRPVAASLPYSLTEGKAGLPSATSTRIRSGRMCSVTHRGVAACSTALVTSSEVEQGGATRDVRRQIAEVRGDPMPSQGRALHDGLEVQRRHAISCRTHGLGGYALLGDTGVIRCTGRRRRRCAPRRSASTRTSRRDGRASPTRAISVAVPASRSMPLVMSSPRRSMRPSEYMIEGVAALEHELVAGPRGAAQARPRSGANAARGRTSRVPSARTTSGGGCPALLSTTRPVDGVMVPTTAVTTRSSIERVEETGPAMRAPRSVTARTPRRRGWHCGPVP